MSLIPKCAEKRECKSKGVREREGEISVQGGSDWDLGLGEWNLVRGVS